MRDPAVRALLALTLSPADLAAIEDGEPLERRFWPVQAAQGGVVVGLAVGDRVVGEAPLVRVESNPRGGARWVFGALVRYLVPRVGRARAGRAARGRGRKVNEQPHECVVIAPAMFGNTGTA